MRASGNKNQWIGGYPSIAVISADIDRGAGFIVDDDDILVAYFAYLPSPEPTYHQIYQGQWLDDLHPYHVVHRIASYPHVHNIFRDILQFCFSHDKNIRIDTHRDNHIMQHCLARYGFTYCGIIYLASGDERLAWQKMI